MLSKQELQKLINESTSFRDAAKKWGRPATHSMLKRWTVKLGVDFSHFKHGKSYDHLVGSKFQMLTVLSVRKADVPQKRRASRWIATCQCECGEIKEIRCDNLDKYVSCGHHAKDRWEMVCGKNPAFKGIGELRAVFVSWIRRSAERRKLDFAVTKEYLWGLFQSQEAKCALTGLPIRFGRIWHHNETTASLDRIDNKKGYVEGNVRWVLKDINMLRADYDTEYFIRLCNLVAKNNPRTEQELAKGAA